ncbi:MAG: hypothetical protein E6833_38765, partial [Bradyrhizobium sp.]|nr:hypothetical protein [Bradyrhizobium sp.]
FASFHARTSAVPNRHRWFGGSRRTGATAQLCKIPLPHVRSTGSSKGVALMIKNKLQLIP